MLEKKKIMNLYLETMKSKWTLVPKEQKSFKVNKHSNKIIIFFDSDLFINEDRVKIAKNLNFSIFLCIYKQNGLLSSNIQLWNDIFIPLTLKDLDKEFKKEELISIIQNFNFQDLFKITNNLEKFEINETLNSAEKNVYIQKKFNLILEKLNQFKKLNSNLLEISLIDFISTTINMTNKFLYWNEITPLSHKINYFENDNGFSHITFNYKNLFCKIYEIKKIILLETVEDLTEYLIKKKINIDFILKKNIYIYMYIYVYFLNYLYWLDTIYTTMKLGDDLFNYEKKEWEDILYILQQNITTISSLSRLGRNILLLDSTISFANDYESLLIGKLSSYSGLIDLEYTNQEKWNILEEEILNGVINSWEDLQLRAQDLNVSDIYEYDLNAAYTYGAIQPLLGGIGYLQETINIEKELGLALCIINTHGKNNYVNFRKALSDNVILSNNTAYGWYFTQELKQLQDLGCSIEIYKGYVYKDYNTFLTTQIKLLNEIKKKINDPIIIKQIKLILNSFYGYFSFKKTINQVNFDNLFHTKKKKVDSLEYSINTCYYNDGKVKCSINTEKKKTNEYPGSIITYANITANNRINLREKIIKLKEQYKGLKIYQINIDSIYININLNIDSKELGEFKFVKKTKIIFFKPQCYIDIDKKYMLANNKKITEFNLFKLELNAIKSKRYKKYYKKFDNNEKKYILDNIDYFKNLSETLERLGRKKTSSEESEILSYCFDENTEKFIKEVKLILKKEKEENDNIKNFSVQFEAIEKKILPNEEPKKFYHEVSVSMNDYVSINSQIKLCLKLNAIQKEWEYKYDEDHYFRKINICLYDKQNNLLDVKELLF